MASLAPEEPTLVGIRSLGVYDPDFLVSLEVPSTDKVDSSRGETAFPKPEIGGEATQSIHLL